MDHTINPAAGTALRFDPRLRSREHALTRARGLIGRIGYRLQGALESAVAACSLHGDPVVYDKTAFAWVAALESQWLAIREELDGVLADEDGIPCFQDILEQVRTIQNDRRWKTFFLLSPGIDCRTNAARCPRTMRALQGIPGIKNAFFSILAPGKHVPPHRGAYNGVLRLHLALRVPDPIARCGIRVGDRLCHWKPGEALIFDDSFNHEAWNWTDAPRAVLFVVFARPLRWPLHALNSRMIDAAAWLPFMRRAARRHREWQRRRDG